MFSGKTKSIFLILLILLAGLFAAQMSGQVVSSWANDLIKAVNISGSTTSQKTHISGAWTDVEDPTDDLASAWDEVAALPVHVSGSENTLGITLHVSGTETEIIDLPDTHVSGSVVAPLEFQNAHFSGSKTQLTGILEARISGSETVAGPELNEPLETAQLTDFEIPDETPTARISGTESEVANLPDQHVSGSTLMETDLESAHLLGTDALLQDIEARISGARMGSGTPVREAHVSGSETKGPENQDAHLSGASTAIVPKSQTAPATPALSVAKPSRITRPQDEIASIPDLIRDLHVSGAPTPAQNIPSAHMSGAETRLAGKDILLRETDSSGSYNHGATKREGSKSKKPSHLFGSGSQAPKMSPHKSEGSKSKSYSRGKSYGGHGKSYGTGYSKYKPYSGHGGGGHSKGYRKHGHTKNPFKHIMKFKHVLGLTDEQLERLKEKEFEYQKVRLRAEAEHKISHMELDRLAHSVTVNESRIRALAGEIIKNKSKKIHAMAEAKIGILNTLTKEQRTKVHKMHLHH
ncbi:MAG: Spy/CpxP family protein refolding chaperone [Nitrospinaceae bacterium]